MLAVTCALWEDLIKPWRWNVGGFSNGSLVEALFSGLELDLGSLGPLAQEVWH